MNTKKEYTKETLGRWLARSKGEIVVELAAWRRAPPKTAEFGMLAKGVEPVENNAQYSCHSTRRYRPPGPAGSGGSAAPARVVTKSKTSSRCQAGRSQALSRRRPRMLRANTAAAPLFPSTFSLR